MIWRKFNHYSCTYAARKTRGGGQQKAVTLRRRTSARIEEFVLDQGLSSLNWYIAMGEHLQNAIVKQHSLYLLMEMSYSKTLMPNCVLLTLIFNDGYVFNSGLSPSKRTSIIANVSDLLSDYSTTPAAARKANWALPDQKQWYRIRCRWNYLISTTLLQIV